MNSDKLEKSLINLNKAVKRFEEALQEPESSIVMDATPALRILRYQYR